MSEPTRWVNDGPGQMRELLRHARKSRPMDPQQRSKTSASVVRLAAVPVGASLLFWIQGIALGAGVGVVGIVAATHVVPDWFRPSSSPTSPSGASIGRISSITVRADFPVPSATVSPPPEAASAAASQAIRWVDAPPTVAVSSSAAPSTDNALGREAALLEQARAALGSSPQRSLDLAQQHANEFPTGMMSIERELVVVDALYRLGRNAEAHSHAVALMNRAKGSLYEERIRRMLGQSP